MIKKIVAKTKAAWADLDTRSTFFLYLLLPLILNLVLECFEHKSFLGGFYMLFAHPLVFICNSMIILATLSVTLLFRRRFFWVALVSFAWVAFGIANFVLLCNRVTPFTASDLYMIDSVFSVAQKYFNIFQMIIVIILLGVAGFGLLVLFFKAPKRKKKINYLKSLGWICVLVLMAVFSLKLATKSGTLESQFTELSKAYLKNGFVYCFTNSLVDTGVAKPKDYSAESIQQIVKNDQANDADEKPVAKPNIIVVQLESFFDITCANNITFNKSPIPNFQKLCKENSSGLFSVPVVGAGTVNTEFEALTGMNIDDFGAGEYPFKTILKDKSCESLAFDLKHYGYSCHGVHNNTGRFYSRNLVYANLGFDDFTSVEYMNDYDTTPTGWAKDGVLTRYIKDCMDSTKGQDLVYTISVQGHGGYSVEVPYTKHVTVTSIDDESMKDQVEYYANQIYEMDTFIGELVDMLKNYGEDTILVMYGDHLPSLDFTDDELNGRSIYQTDYFIWNNMGLKFPNGDIQANQLSSRLLKTLNMKTGVVNSYHQNHEQEPDFYKGLASLEYDILYGNQLVFNGKSPYHTSDMRMSLSTVSIKQVIADQFSTSGFYVRGENFTKYSKVYVDDEKMPTEFIDPNTLRFLCDDLTYQQKITVWQSKLSRTKASTYDTITLQKQITDEDAEIDDQNEESTQD